MTVTLTHAMGAEVTVFTTSEGKAKEAFQLGAKHVVKSKVPEDMVAASSSLDLIVDTVGTSHEIKNISKYTKSEWHTRFSGNPSISTPFISSLPCDCNTTFAGSFVYWWHQRNTIDA
uniref:Putative zinc-type alcohol dehydrogenase-like protein YahK n=1 Tax=Lygus hesperus TaxID=30085 RepID=A0A0A9Z7R8_LYGHE